MMLYIGLFSIILIIVISFMLSTQESARRTEGQENLFRSSQFINQHINIIVNEADSIDETNTVFDDDEGHLGLIIDTLPKSYQLINQRLYFDGTVISNSKIVVNKFYISPVYDELDIVGVRLDIEIADSSNLTVIDEINILKIFE